MTSFTMPTSMGAFISNTQNECLFSTLSTEIAVNIIEVPWFGVGQSVFKCAALFDTELICNGETKRCLCLLNGN